MSDGRPSYPDALEIVPFENPARGEVAVPGSKSITNRALVLAALHADRERELVGALRSEDTEVMINALRQLGFRVEPDWEGYQPLVRVFPREGDRIIPAAEADLYVANSGTTMRFLTAMVALGKGRYRLDGTPRMRKRPIKDLLDALQQLGVNAYSERGDGCPPVVVESDGLKGKQVTIKGDVSSQFLSALMLAAPCAEGEVTVTIQGPLVSGPYFTMTAAMLARDWGLDFANRPQGLQSYAFPGRQRATLGGFYDIEPDATAASYFFGAAAVTGGAVRVRGLPWQSIQGDIGFVNFLAYMGCRVGREERAITVEGGALRGVRRAYMSPVSDTMMTLAAVACFAEGPTDIYGVAHVRHKESDRIAAIAAELRRLGAEVEEQPDGLTITPRPLHGAAVETYDDHRIAMSLALIGLKVPGVVIKNPGCVAKTYPNFFEDLEKLRQ
jgi:3-phosphoshikimate 1-carboxyvinyltransferase